jgi:CheY-like chemotaxis protein/DNA-directed RNA polymerase specialized sigma24 family protein
MTDLTHSIGRHLPYLRRYARAVTGSQERGDKAVRSCLEALLAAPHRLKPATLRRDLFRALSEVWMVEPEIAAGRGSGMVANTSILTSRMAYLAPPQRQALLLTTLEGFTLDEASHILGLTQSQAAEFLVAAKADLRTQRATRILIIEDEPIIALDLQTTVEQHGHSVVGIAATHLEAVELAREHAPGLVLADIQLKDDSSGLEAVQEILSTVSLPVIFISAFPERLLTGERPEPTFLITKPFDPDTLAVSISQALATADS